MTRHASASWFVGLLLLSTQWACDGGGDEVDTAPEAAAIEPVAQEQVTVAGTLGIDSSATDAGQSADLGNREVALLDSDENLIGTAATDPSGAFSIAIDTSGLSLTQDPAQPSPSTNPRFTTIRSLFQADSNGETGGDALGLQKTVIIDPTKAELNLGAQNVKQVGAIIGKVTLVSGEDPTGIVLYIPGTTYSARAAADGSFILGFLPNGVYTLRAEKDGFTSQQWENLTIENQSTALIPDTVLDITSGPAVDRFALKDDATTTFAPLVELEVALQKASRYRISQLPDFRDAQWRVWNSADTQVTIPFLIGGSDGIYDIYLEAADADGLTGNATIRQLRLDTQAPVVPTFTAQGADARLPGYSRSTTVRLEVDNCQDVARLFVTEDATAVPTPAEFLIACDAATPQEFDVSSGEGAKDLYVWAIDAVDRISLTPRQGRLVLDTTAPTLALTPSADMNPNGTTGGIAKYVANKLTNVTVTATDSNDVAAFYTVDGSVPSAGSRPVYDNSVVVTDSGTYKYKAYDAAGNQSTVESHIYELDLLDPVVPRFVIRTANAADGFANNTSALLFVDSCLDIDQFYLTEDAMATPTAMDFTIDCDENNGEMVTLSSGDNTKNVYLWAIDPAGRIGTPKSGVVRLITATPTVTIDTASIATNGVDGMGNPRFIATSIAQLPVSTSDDSIVDVYYTLDGSTPTVESRKVFDGKIILSQPGTVKYKGFDLAGNASVVTTHIYDIDLTDPIVPQYAIRSTSSEVGFTNTTSVKLYPDNCVDISEYYITENSGKTPLTTDFDSPMMPDQVVSCDTVTAQDMNVSAGTGTKTVFLWARDPSGRISSVSRSYSLEMDTTDPSVTVDTTGFLDSTDGGGNPTKVINAVTSVPVTTDANATVYYTLDGSTPTRNSRPVFDQSYLAAETEMVKFKAFDKAGNESSVTTVRFVVDLVPPTLPAFTIRSSGAQAGFTDSTSPDLYMSGCDDIANLAVTTVDSEPAIGAFTVACDESNPEGLTVAAGEGDKTLYLWAIDEAQNISASVEYTVVLDSLNPDVDVTLTGFIAGTDGGGNPTYTINSVGGVPVISNDPNATVYYTLDGSTPTENSQRVFEGSYIVSTTQVVKFKSFDKAGNESSVETVRFIVDLNKPVLPSFAIRSSGAQDGFTDSTTPDLYISSCNDIANLALTTTNSEPAIGAFTLTCDDSSGVSVTVAAGEGAKTLYLWAIDTAQNISDSVEYTVTLDSMNPDVSVNVSSLIAGTDGGGNPTYTSNAVVGVPVTSTDSNATIFYTLDGSTPTQSSQRIYEDTFVVTTTQVAKFKSFDKAGNESSVETVRFIVDLAKPVVPDFEIRSSAAIGGYSNSTTPDLFMESCNDIANLALTTSSTEPAVGAFTISCDDSAGVSVTIASGEGTKNLYLWAIDTAQNISEGVAYDVVLDTSDPAITIDNSGLIDNGTDGGGNEIHLWNDSTSIPVSTDATAKVYYTFDGSTPSKSSFEILGNTAYVVQTSTLKLKAIDFAGNESAAETYIYQIDLVDPIVPEYTIRSGAAQDGFTNSTTPNLFVEGCTDIANLALTTTNSEPLPAAFTISCNDSGGEAVSTSASGNYYLWAIDSSGRISASSRAINIVLDQANPTLSFSDDSGTYGDTLNLEITATDTSKVDIHYTFDTSDPTASSPKIQNGLLSLNNSETVKFRAIDFAGNQSAVETKNYVIDLQGPTVAYLELNTTQTLFSSGAIPLKILSSGATEMRFANIPSGSGENLLTALDESSWVSIASTATYNLQDYFPTLPALADGTIEIYVEVRDDADHRLVSAQPVTITYDTTAPSGTISLLSPETPTANLKQVLGWSSAITEDVTYQVVVIDDGDAALTDEADTTTECQNAGRSGTNRFMVTTKTTAQINPALPNGASGIYYWCVRALDSAGNATDWVASNAGENDKSFELRNLGEAFAASESLEASDDAAGFAKEIVAIGDISGDGSSLKSEVAFSILGGGSSSCPGCGTVKIYDPENNLLLGTIVDPANNARSGFGHAITACDIDNDGTDELIVSAPFHGQTVTDALTVNIGASPTDFDVTYYGAGAVYAFETDTRSQLAVIEPSLGSSPAREYHFDQNVCLEYVDHDGGQACVIYGTMPPEPLNSLAVQPPPVRGRYFGYDVACQRQAGADNVLIAEPGYISSPGNAYDPEEGRVQEYSYSGGTFSQEGSDITHPSAQPGVGFATDLAFLPNFRLNSVCDTAGATLAVNSPRGDFNGAPRGAVQIFQGGGGAWADCAEIGPSDGDDPEFNGFGARLHPVGTMGGSIDILGVSTAFMGGGDPERNNTLVRFFGSASNDDFIKSIRFVDSVDDNPDAAQRYGGAFGYNIVPIGDFDDDNNTDLAFASPLAVISGRREAGVVQIFTWDSIGTDAADGLESVTEVQKIIGDPHSQALLGTSVASVFNNGEGLTDKPAFTLIGRPSFLVSDPSLVGGGGGSFVDNCPYPRDDFDPHLYFARNPDNTNECWLWEFTGIPLFPFGFIGEPTYGACQGINHHTNPEQPPKFLESCEPVFPGDDNDGGEFASEMPPGELQIYQDIQLTPGTVTKVTGKNSYAHLGKSFMAVPDIDSDGVDDLIVGQPGGRCNGAPYGAMTLLSMLDFELTHSVCGTSADEQLGLEAYFMPEQDQILFAALKFDGGPSNQSLRTFAMPATEEFLFFYDTFAPPGSGQELDVPAPDSTRFFIAPPVTIPDPDGGGPLTSLDAMVVGDPDDAPAGFGGRLLVSYYDAAGANFINKCVYRGQEDDDLGYSAALAGDYTGDGFPEIIVGAPGNDRIYIIKSEHYNGPCNSNFSNPGTYRSIVSTFDPDGGGPAGPEPVAWVIDASSIPALSGVTIEEGFGANVLSLSNMGESADDYLYVANTNMRMDEGEQTPQFFVFELDRSIGGTGAFEGAVDLALEVNKTGTAGTMLGGYARLLGGHNSTGDINGDGAPEIVISHPTGQTSYGATGLVKIYNGKQLVNMGGADPAPAVLQTIFNPEPVASNFGVFIDYTDVNGDEIPDFLIGADKYNTSNYTEAGALFVIPIVPASN